MRIRLIGLSVSACIYDIATGVVDESDVVCIIGGTSVRCGSATEMAQLVEAYRTTAWRGDHFEECRLLYYLLMDSGRIIQPRLAGLPAITIPGGGHWAVQVDHEMLKTIKLMKQVEEGGHGG